MPQPDAQEWQSLWERLREWDREAHDVLAAAWTAAHTEAHMDRMEITQEQWREYDFGGRVYRIEKPVALYTRPGGTTHRVVDAAGVVHCVPAPGHQGCALRWYTGQPDNPVQF